MVTDEEKKQILSQLYYYLQDISFEIQADRNILQIVETYLKPENSKKLHFVSIPIIFGKIPKSKYFFSKETGRKLGFIDEYVGECTIGERTVYKFTGKTEIEIVRSSINTSIKSMAKVALHSIILCLCRIEEAISRGKEGVIINTYLSEYAPDFLKRFEALKQLYKLNEMRTYRNTYIAHPFDNKTKTFAKRTDIIDLYKKIFNSKDTRIEDLNMKDFTCFLKNLHCLDNDNPDTSLVWAISKLATELEENGVKLERK